MSLATLTYRNATREDLPQIVALYNSTIPSRIVTADIEPVSVEEKNEWFAQHNSETRPLWIVEIENKIIGWVSFQSFYGRPAYSGTAEISVYLDETARGKGFGKIILQHCIESCNNLKIHTLLGFIFAHNVRSLKLFRDADFKDWALLPDVAILDGRPASLIIVGKKID